MKILVTGGAGFIGSHLTEALLGRGEDVAVMDDFNAFYDPLLKRENVGPFLSKASFRLFEGDIRDTAFVKSAFDSFMPQAVCHLAARAGVRPSIEDPALYEQVNIAGTLNMLEAAKGAGVGNFVFASSSSVYGADCRAPFSEDEPPLRPISPYAATKMSGELLCHTYSHLYGMPATCLRFFTVYGERGRPDMAVAKFTRLIREGRPIDVYGDGTAKRDFTYISDIISGLAASIYTPFRYEVMNLGGSHTSEVNGLISLIEGALGMKARVNYREPAPGDVPITYADVTKAARLLGFAPRVRLDEGVARYVEWFLAREARNLSAGPEGGTEVRA